MSIAETMIPTRVLVQILLPTVDGRGVPVPKSLLRTLATDLARRFGGVTSYLHAPAEGLWLEGETVQRDDIVVLEVMTAEFDRGFWRALKARMEAELTQSEIVVRAQSIATV
jgi:hypothetical protein